MKREFTYSKKESYTSMEVESLLQQHNTFVSNAFKGYVAKDEHDKISEELKGYKKTDRKNHIATLVKDLTSQDKINDAISLSNIQDDMEDKVIIDTVKKTISERAYLKNNIDTPGLGKTNITSEETEEDDEPQTLREIINKK